MRKTINPLSENHAAAQLVVDGLATLGVPARVLQLNGHVTAEYFVEQRWIFAEADLFNHGQEVCDQQGNFLGLDSSEFYSRLEAPIKPYTRPTCHQLRGIRVGDWGSLSTAELRNFWREIFRPVRYEVSGGDYLTTPFTHSKMNSPRSWNRSRFYEWAAGVSKPR